MIAPFKDKFQTLLELDLSTRSRLERMGIRMLQILYSSIRDLTDGQFSLRAMSLVYTTLITMVPLLAISFSVLKGFGVHNQIEPFLINLLEGLGPEKALELSEKVIEFVDNVKVSVLGAVGVALLIYAVIALMQKIEAAFNYIWRVAADRTFAQRFSDYLSVLLMGPLLIFLSAGITTTIRNMPIVESINQFSMFELVYDLSSFVFPWLIMAAGFTFFYIYMPNTKVKPAAAFAGGMVAALLWKTMGYLFSSFIATSVNYVAIYAAFATLIILMIWLYASWLVVLIGANISFYVQYPRYLRVSREPLVLSPHLRTLLGLSIMILITRSYYRHDPAWTQDQLSRNLNVPILAIQNVLEHLVEGGILTPGQQDPSGYYPAVPLDTTPVEKVVEVLEKQGRKGWLQTERMHTDQKAHDILDQIKQARSEALTSQSIRDVLG